MSSGPDGSTDPIYFRISGFFQANLAKEHAVPKHSAAMKDRSVTMLVALPPPIHGMSTVNQRMMEEFSQRAKVSRFNLAPSFAHRLFPGVAWKLTRAIYLLFLLPVFFLHSIRFESKTLYVSVSGGSGQWLELPFVFLAGFFYSRIYVHHHSFAYCDQYERPTHWLHKVGRGKMRHITLCDRMSKLLSEKYRIEHRDIVVLGNLAFFPVEKTKAKARVELRSIGFLGNITREKGIVEFIDVCRTFSELESDLRFVIAGPCADSSLLTLVESACRDLPALRYVGAVYSEAKTEFFNEIDVLLFPSTYPNEAQPLTIFEAFSFGIPVIAWARGCIEEMILNGAGEVVRADCPFVESCSSTLRHWLKNPEEFGKLVHSLPDRILERQKLANLTLESLRSEIISPLNVNA